MYHYLIYKCDIFYTSNVSYKLKTHVPLHSQNPSNCELNSSDIELGLFSYNVNFL